MSTRLFVGNLSYNTQDDDLRRAFAVCGDVTSAEVVVDRDSGRSRGFGFVEFESSGDAQQAIQMLDGTALDGRNVNVNEARKRSGGGAGSSGGPRRRDY